MRAKEFITEYNAKSSGKSKPVSDAKDSTLPGVFVQHQLRNTDPYMQYRYGIAVAAARANKEHGVEFDQESPWAENLTQVMYAPEDEETIKLASKLMGVTPSRITDNASHEPEFVNKNSTVAKTKRNKHGV
jgi:hypothetical protein